MLSDFTTHRWGEKLLHDRDSRCLFFIIMSISATQHHHHTNTNTTIEGLLRFSQHTCVGLCGSITCCACMSACMMFSTDGIEKKSHSHTRRCLTFPVPVRGVLGVKNLVWRLQVPGCQETGQEKCNHNLMLLNLLTRPVCWWDEVRWLHYSHQ